MGKSNSKMFRKRSSASTHDLTWRRFGSVISLKNSRLTKSHNQPPLPPLPVATAVTTATTTTVTTPTKSPEASTATRSTQKSDTPAQTCDPAIETNPEIASDPRRSLNGGGNSGKHRSIDDWLRVLSLEQYANLFSKYNGVEDIIDFTEADIKQLGIKMSSHRAFMSSSLEALRNKFYGTTKKPFSRHSVAVDSRKQIMEEERISHLKTIVEAIQSKSLDDLKMEPCMDPSMDPSALKKVLEFELSLDSQDIRSHAWYHGAIPRSRAEEIVREEGCFLIRDCTSQPGNFVLTCRKVGGQPLHFVINKLVLQPNTVYERVQYHFEDEHFDTVPDLITAYVASGKPITALSAAVIQFPVNRLYPLTYYATKYINPLYQGRCSAGSSASPTGPNPYHCKPPLYKTPSPTRPSRCDIGSPQPQQFPSPTTAIGCGGSMSRGGSKKQRSHSLTPAEVNRMSHQEKCNSADGVIQAQQQQQQGSGGAAGSMSRSTDGAALANCSKSKFSSQSLPRKPCGKLTVSPSSITLGRNNMPHQHPHHSHQHHMGRVFSNHSLCEDDLHQQQQHSRHSGSADSPPPPPKPCRLSSLPPRSESCKEDMFDCHQQRLSGGSVHSTGSGGSSSGYHHHHQHHHHNNQASGGSDSGNGSGDSALSSATSGEPCTSEPIRFPSGVVIKNPRYHLSSSDSNTTLKNFNFDFDEMEAKILAMPMPKLSQIDDASRFELEAFQTILLPVTENKPLDGQTLDSVKLMLREYGSRILANHLTRCDLDLVFGGRNEPEADKSRFGNGLELCTLPHGHQFRLDIIERTECFKLLVAVTILTCTDETDRVEILNRWIEVAIDTKTGLGNLYGFSGIMLGLSLPQIQKLDSTWHSLRQKYTDHAYMFEAKLRPTLKSMNECSNPQAPNTTIPHLMPYVLLMEHANDLSSGAVGGVSSSTSLQSVGEQCAAEQQYQNIAAYQGVDLLNMSAAGVVGSSMGQDYGLGMVFAHWDNMRKALNSHVSYQRNADIVLGEARLEEMPTDMFRTEFHLKFLWGSRGSLAPSAERHSKFDKVLTALAERYCGVPPEFNN